MGSAETNNLPGGSGTNSANQTTVIPMRKRKQHREDKSQLIRVEDDDGLVGAGALDTSAMTQNY